MLREHMRLMTTQRDSDRLYLEYHVSRIHNITCMFSLCRLLWPTTILSTSSLPFAFSWAFLLLFSTSTTSPDRFSLTPQKFRTFFYRLLDMERANEELAKSNVELRKQLDTANNTLLAMQEQITKLAGERTTARDDESSTGSEASSSAQSSSSYNTRSKKGR